MFRRVGAFSRWAIVVVMVIIAGSLMLNASGGDSGIVDELAHIPAGYSYVRYLDYRLNPEHPPLVKLLAGIPLLFQGVNFPVDRDAWQKDINGQWAVGSQFLYESGNDPGRTLRYARFGPILLTLVLIVAVYLWSKEQIGRWWALLPAFLVAFSPTFLAHGHYVTTDIGATLGIFVATIALLAYLFSQTKKRLWLASLAFGLAQLMKFSAFLLVPFFGLLVIVFCIVNRRNFWRELKSLILIFLIGYALVYVVYFFLIWNYPPAKQVADTDFILGSFSPRFLPQITVWLAGVPFLRPIAQYLLGFLMVLQRSSGGNTVYFLGEVSSAGNKLYFPLTFLMKEPLPSLLMVLFAFALSAWAAIKSAFAVVFRRSRALLEYLNTGFAEFAMVLFIFIYWASSISSHLNIGIRHILPTLPFIYILTAEKIRGWFSLKNLDAVRNFALKIFILYQELTSISIKSAVLAIFLIWYLVSTLLAAPYFLSYFNPLAGGIWGGYKYVTDSNYDWGQDLKRLRIWVDQSLPPGEKIAVDYFGAGRPSYYLGSREVDWWSAKGSPSLEGIKWLAVSINTIQGAKGTLHPGQLRKPEDEYRWLTDPYNPHARAGTSIFVYKLE